MSLASGIDTVLTQLSAFLARGSTRRQARLLETAAGRIHVIDSADGDADAAPRPCIVFTPDGPNVVAHYRQLLSLLAPHFRIVCFDMPGFGFSLPAAGYGHALDQGACVVLELMDALNIPRATLAFSCANGLYAVQAARLAPHRIASLVLSQTPSLPEMQAWARRMIPRPLRLPVTGQLLTWLIRRPLASRWYRHALPRQTDASPFQRTARHAFDNGACFCLAGVVQGLLRESVAGSFPDLPCTLIWGDLDASHRLTPPESLTACLPQATVVRFTDCGHFPDLEQPERYVRTLISHMERLAKKPADL